MNYLTQKKNFNFYSVSEPFEKDFIRAVLDLYEVLMESQRWYTVVTPTINDYLPPVCFGHTIVDEMCEGSFQECFDIIEECIAYEEFGTTFNDLEDDEREIVFELRKDYVHIHTEDFLEDVFKVWDASNLFYFFSEEFLYNGVCISYVKEINSPLQDVW